MSRRCVSRYLLSLLMLWQLFASAFAHPLGLRQHALTQVVTHAAHVSTSAEHCHEQGMAMSAMSDMDISGMRMHSDQVQSAHGDSCKSACKCPCAGTPALSFTGDFIAPACHQAIYEVGLTDGIASQPPSKLLRPPI